MTRQEAGRLGGLATYRKHGREHMAEIGARALQGSPRSPGAGGGWRWPGWRARAS
jgi:hypothetical protein